MGQTVGNRFNKLKQTKVRHVTAGEDWQSSLFHCRHQGDRLADDFQHSERGNTAFMLCCSMIFVTGLSGLIIIGQITMGEQTHGKGTHQVG